jgi:hypothetical protein
MTREEIEALEKLLGAATQGVWFAPSQDPCYLMVPQYDCSLALFECDSHDDPGEDERNCVLTAAAVNALGDLCAAAKREIALREWVTKYANHTRGCDQWDCAEEVPCTCGLDEILGEVKQDG